MKNLSYKKLSTALISDVLDEEGYTNQMFPINIKPNFEEAKIFGKARIMNLKRIDKGEEYKEVYRGLHFMESLGKGDILVVANGFENLAFFGELMSSIGKSKGIEGAVIDGCTRDVSATRQMKYPVFAKNNTAQDIKNRGIVDKLDLESVRIGNVQVNKGDYLFGDSDGVIVIPAKIKEKVIERAIKVFDLEIQIKKKIWGGASVKELLEKFKEF